MISMPHLERLLQVLPLLAIQCDDCQEDLAVMRDQSGRHYCPSCAWLRAKAREASEAKTAKELIEV